jgi:alkanesulfonate monooxygenase SsuD/methylene tetrahydromethanopterin reductase-like flavin-dependent oxidoreductase (luciferase family)
VEHAAYCYEFPPIRERMDRPEEALTIIKAMFTEERPSFSGRYYRIEDALNVPRPVHAGGPPILVGGGGEQRTLKIAARFADLTHWFPLGAEMLRHKTEVLAGYCEAIGRDPATIERTMQAPVAVAATEADAARMLDFIPPSGAAASSPGRRNAPQKGCGHTSISASRASRSTTRCTARPTRSRSSASSCGSSKGASRRRSDAWALAQSSR